jgi:site-specific DNA recombinase
VRPRGKACYGKTELRPRQRITRPLRQRNGVPSRDSANHERPRQEWIEVPVPALVGEAVFAMAQEQLQKNAHHSPRRTIEPTLLQGMLVCQQCGYALYRTSTRTSKQKLHYYRCLGSDGYRRLKGPVCTNRPVRQDSLDQTVWDEIIRLLDDPSLIQSEIDRRRQAAFETNPSRKREEELRREQARLDKNIERIISAYQEALVTLPQLRQRIPELHRQIHTVEAELKSLEMAAVDDARYLQLAETLATFRGKLRARAETLDVGQRQQILRLLVKEILVGNDTITIRHSLPIGPSGFAPAAMTPPDSGMIGTSSGTGYLLRSGSHLAAACQYLPALRTRPVGYGVAQNPCQGRCNHRSICGRLCAGVSASRRSRELSEAVRGADGGVRTGASSGENTPDKVRAVCGRGREAERDGKTGNVQFSGVHAYLQHDL